MTNPHNTKLHLICGLVVASFVGAGLAEMFDHYNMMHLELYFSIGMSCTMIGAFAIGIWTFLDWREEKKKDG